MLYFLLIIVVQTPFLLLFLPPVTSGFGYHGNVFPLTHSLAHSLTLLHTNTALPMTLCVVAVALLCAVMAVVVAEYPVSEGVAHKRFYIYPLSLEHWYAFPVSE